MARFQEVGMQDHRENFKLIKAARLIDGLGSPPQERMALLVEGSKIRAVGPEESISAPEGSPVVEYNYSSQTVLPGLVDAHTHLNGFGDGRSGEELGRVSDDILLLQSARNADVALSSGVTTLRENGAKGRTTFSLREAILQGITRGPRLVLCGRAVTITGGHMWYFGSEADGVDGVRKEVRKLIKEGADYIKVPASGGGPGLSPYLPSFTLEELRVINEEAHKFGKLTAAHCLGTQSIVNALEAGFDMIIHCVFREPDGTYRFREDVAERIAKQGVWVNPTLHISYLKFQGRGQREHLSEAEHTMLDHAWEARWESCRRMVAMGLKMVAGSDSAWADYPMGGFVHEIQALVEAGHSPMQAILAATRDSAASIGVGDIVGTIEPGMEADLLVVDGDPSADTSALRNVVSVFQGGAPLVTGQGAT